MGNKHLNDVRSEAKAIMRLDDAALAALSHSKSVKRNLSRTVRHLDELAAEGGEDRTLANGALRRLGFADEV